MLQRRFNCPRSTSMGRLFDAAAGLLGIRSVLQYEAHAAIGLEQAAMLFVEQHGWSQPMIGGWTIDEQGRLDLLPVLATLIDDGKVTRAAARFHATLVAGLTDWVMQASASSGVTTLAWGGGCFLNTLLSCKLREQLEPRGIRVLAPLRTSPGDASIALGQAWVAMNFLATKLPKECGN
jgi:hydrogenase maturation protein HypF